LDSAQQQSQLPTPSYSGRLKNPDQYFIDSENFSNKFSYHISQNMEKTNRRTWKRLNGRKLLFISFSSPNKMHT